MVIAVAVTKSSCSHVAVLPCSHVAVSCHNVAEQPCSRVAKGPIGVAAKGGCSGYCRGERPSPGVRSLPPHWIAPDWD